MTDDEVIDRLELEFARPRYEAALDDVRAVLDTCPNCGTFTGGAAPCIRFR